MFIATLIAPVGRLDPALVESLRNAWGGQSVQWLAPDEAAAFALETRPDNFWDVWQDLQNLSTDLVLGPIDGRRKKLLLADMDSTMIQQECIDELAEEAGVGSRVKEITARAMNGELDFEGALLERVGLLKGLDASIIDSVIENRITFMPGGKTLVSTMRANWRAGGVGVRRVHGIYRHGGRSAWVSRNACERVCDRRWHTNG
ncbi:putative phosphoserine phosphatase [Nymphon striatum]|nr:putative phosphoserine phosphatase [Nymphon striatum]